MDPQKTQVHNETRGGIISVNRTELNTVLYQIDSIRTIKRKCTKHLRPNCCLPVCPGNSIDGHISHVRK